MKYMMVIISFTLMLASLGIAYSLCPGFWQAFLINTSTSFLALGMGLIFVNIYLERNARKGAIKSLLVLSHRAIIDYHNDFLTASWAKFGRDAFGKIIDEYIEADLAPQALKQQVRQDIYGILKNNKSLQSRIHDLEESLTELSRLAGWSLDARLLEACLDARISIGRLNATELDDSEKAIDAVTEHILDIDIHSNAALEMLKKLAGINDED